MSKYDISKPLTTFISINIYKYISPSKDIFHKKKSINIYKYINSYSNTTPLYMCSVIILLNNYWNIVIRGVQLSHQQVTQALKTFDKTNPLITV